MTNPRKSRTLSGVFNSIPAWENQDHRLVTDYLLPSNHLMMQWHATPAMTVTKKEITKSVIYCTSFLYLVSEAVT